MFSVKSSSQFSVFSHSLGDHSVHDLPSKLNAAALAGFTRVEISTIDLEYHALVNSISLLCAANEIGELCRLLGLHVICLQPLRDVVEAKKAKEAAARAAQLFPIMDALGTQLLLCCSSSLSGELISGSFTKAVENLRAIGDAAAGWTVSPKKVAFEALCWGTFINTWSQAWDVVRAVDLENVGICLDSFNMLAREWADPTVKGGAQDGADGRILISFAKLSEIPAAKIFLLQIADARRLPEPIPQGTFETPALMTWSRSSRLFPMEINRGAYLPVQALMRAVLQTGYDGPWSVEVFNKSLFDEEEAVPEQHAIRAFEGLTRLERAMSRQNVIISDLNVKEGIHSKLPLGSIYMVSDPFAEITSVPSVSH